MPKPETMFRPTYYQLDHYEKKLIKFQSKYENFPWKQKAFDYDMMTFIQGTSKLCNFDMNSSV